MLPGTIVMLILIVIFVFGGAIALVTMSVKAAERRRVVTEDSAANE